MATVQTLSRKFRYGGRDLIDPDPTMTVNEVLQHFAKSFVKLMGGKVVDIGDEGDSLIFELRENFGDNG